ncbi:hypothetical protein KB1_10900 [Cutibacterium modestum]|uniref:Uncharacterized protein n=2 Tax=Cutibacterium modestum TaxID=2559073 RepID=A0AAD1NVH8_9ACTN|nr:hypothetical protein KB1_10900 [Cutibacterium modestum]
MVGYMTGQVELVWRSNNLAGYQFFNWGQCDSRLLLMVHPHDDAVTPSTGEFDPHPHSDLDSIDEIVGDQVVERTVEVGQTGRDDNMGDP